MEKVQAGDEQIEAPEKWNVEDETPVVVEGTEGLEEMVDEHYTLKSLVALTPEAARFAMDLSRANY